MIKVVNQSCIMASKRFRKTAIRRATVCLLFILFLVLILIYQMDTTTEFDDNLQGTWTFSKKPFGTLQTSCGHEEAFAFIPAVTVRKWSQTDFLIVFGIPSVDNDGRRRRRALQRATCWTFPGVATRANGHSGSLLVLYALARHPAHGFALSESLRLEAQQWHDIVNLPMNEGRVTTNKTIAGPGNWGNEAEIGMGRKTFFWLQLVLRAFPLAVHVGKGDDDMIMNVPQYLADLRLLPRRGTYWGTYVGAMVLKNKKMERVDVKFIVGFSVALARDVAEVVVGYEPLQRIISLPYTKENELDFLVLNVNFEDIMVGRVLKETRYPAIFVADQLGCRFHDSEKGKWTRNISEHSLIAHHLSEDEYYTFMSYFMKNDIKIHSTIYNKLSPTFYSVQCPFK